jgi:uncharacterized FlaG/YvyC family protein
MMLARSTGHRREGNDQGNQEETGEQKEGKPNKESKKEEEKTNQHEELQEHDHLKSFPPRIKKHLKISNDWKMIILKISKLKI